MIMEAMSIVVKGEGKIKEFDVHGLIKPMTDAKKFTDTLSVCKKGDSAVVNIYDSYSLGSSLIGFLIKLATKEGVDLTIRISNEDLRKTLEELQLQEVLRFQRL